MSRSSCWLLPTMPVFVLVPNGVIAMTLRYDAAVSRVPSGASA